MTTKTPEEMAQQYISTIADTHSVKTACEKAFIAGYQRKAIEELSSVQKEELIVYAQAVDAYVAAYKTAQDQLADADKVMPDTCEHILDMSKMVDVSSSATLNNWISVEDKSPEINQRVLLATNEKRSIVTGYRLPPAGKNEPWFHTDLGLWCGTETVTHWQPLPEPPKEEE